MKYGLGVSCRLKSVKIFSTTKGWRAGIFETFAWPMDEGLASSLLMFVNHE
jgi:hypothetical protein